MNETVLVVAAHADDEALGCGGTVARHVAEGYIVHVVFMADGVTSRSGAERAELEARLSAAQRAQAILGVSHIHSLELPDNRMDSLPLLEVIQHLEPIVEELRPHLVYTHHHGDLNVDHRITHQAVMTACRPLPGHSVKEIRCFEVLSNTEWGAPAFAPFEPNIFVDISAYLDVKQAALAAYQGEMRDVPHSRSAVHAEVLARHRGYCVGLQAAEAFALARRVC
jgi:LmbE family N-acetylglucosaminyl deacetylase